MHLFLLAMHVIVLKEGEYCRSIKTRPSFRPFQEKILCEFVIFSPNLANMYEYADHDVKHTLNVL